MSAQTANSKKRASVIPNLDAPQQTTQVTQEQPAAAPVPTQVAAPTPTTEIQQPAAQSQSTAVVESLDTQPPQTPTTSAPTQKTSQDIPVVAAPTPTPNAQATSSPTPPTTTTTPQAATPTSVSTSKPTPPTPTYGEIPLEKKNSQLYHIGIALLIIILGLTGILLYMRSTSKSQQTEQAEEMIATPAPTEAPTPEPTPEIKQLEKSEIILEILNGTGVAGLAGSTAATFEDLGYTVESVGNTESTQSNQLIVASEYAEQIEPLLEDVKSELNITKITQEEDGLGVIARIIIGEAP